MTTIDQLGEFGLIHHLTKQFEPKHKSTLKSIGDDAAVIDSGNKKMIISTDLLIEGIHFDMHYVPLMHLGYKAVSVNVSDIYAMNAAPKQITVSIAVSSKYTVEALTELYAGIAHACKHYGVDLVGGDTTAAPSGMVISITVIGEAAEEDIVYRNGAKEGNLICVSGDLGAAYLGLQILEREKKLFLEHPEMEPEFEGADYLIKRQLKAEARKDIIEWMHDVQLKPTSMIDVSDGLASDMMHICKQSAVGCELHESRIPIAEEAYQMALQFNLDPSTCSLNGGEDYELLFTIESEDETKVASNPDISIIGQIVKQADGLVLLSKGGNKFPLQAQGWKHF